MISKATQKWLVLAQEDLRDAKALLEYENKFLKFVVFASQQAAEKAIKAYLTQSKSRYPNTHDIEDLLKLVSKINGELSEKLFPAQRLTAYAIAFRYPDAATEELNMEVAHRAVKIADETLSAILASIET
ncbi:HEPN domain-containing protein [Bdellovibrio bacteriovorus]|uniref:HEPN domain-containing protein n=1 Tax=Bdellovibrio TaxID=958 RepID=UPI0035A8F717